MGYVWKRCARNVVINPNSLVHIAFRDVAPGNIPRMVMVACTGHLHSTNPTRTNALYARYTTRMATCIRCLGST